MNPKVGLLDAVIELISYAHANELDAHSVLCQLLDEISQDSSQAPPLQPANLPVRPRRVPVRPDIGRCWAASRAGTFR